jgi:hypothetical protein
MLRLADLTLAELMRHLARYGGTILEEDGLLLFAGAHPHPNPYRNGAIRLDECLEPQDVLARAQRFFAPRKRGYVLWAREHADDDLGSIAESAGAHVLEEPGLPEFFLGGLPEELPPPEGITLRSAEDERTRRDYVRVVADGWGMRGISLELAAAIFFDPESVNAPNVSAYVAYMGDVPVSGAMTLVSHGVALGCQAATVRRLDGGTRLPAPASPKTRRRGLADSCLWAALKRSFEDLGARGSLCQASQTGAAVWTRFGYRPITSYRRYLVRPVTALSDPPGWG